MWLDHVAFFMEKTMSMTLEERLAFFDWENGEWRENTRNINGKNIYQYSFSVKYTKTFMGHTFAKIKSTNDGRWRWWKIPSNSFIIIEQEGPFEGVCQTLEEAKIKALEGLPVCISQLS